MTREEAAALLGVGAEANENSVRAAFRARARATHPDRGGSADDLALLTEARDVLLDVPAAAPKRPTSTAPATATRPASAPRPSVRREALLTTLIWRMGLGFGSLLVVATIAVVVVAIATGDGSNEPTTPIECLAVSPDGVTETGCDTAGAQRVVAELTGPRTCPAGSNSLVVGSTTWCLEPIAG